VGWCCLNRSYSLPLSSSLIDFTTRSPAPMSSIGSSSTQHSAGGPDADNLQLRCSTDAGSTFDTGLELLTAGICSGWARGGDLGDPWPIQRHIRSVSLDTTTAWDVELLHGRAASAGHLRLLHPLSTSVYKQFSRSTGALRQLRRLHLEEETPTWLVLLVHRSAVGCAITIHDGTGIIASGTIRTVRSIAKS
jgi:hypothetical protein